MVEIRGVRESELDSAGELCVDAYLAGGVVTNDDPYLPTLRNVAARAGDASAQVLVATASDRIVGTVTYCPFGSPLTTVCRDGEFEFRFLAVAVEQQGNGLATALIDACESLARTAGLTTSIACVTDTNTGAAALYRKLGFAYVPERDWHPMEGVNLETYERPIATEYCGRCGAIVSGGDHTACEGALVLEPPRYCAVCRRRMIVQITPTGWKARCKQHGEI
ncbi:MAG: GNAT family N-acetyltransferase, partial [Candidatus Nanopelagicales bacterium]